jgi:ferrous iron transport protein B
MVDQDESILASIGHFITPMFSPLGFGDWRAAVATVTGLAAKENVVSTLSVLLGVSEGAESTPALLASVAGMFSMVSAYAFMVFNMLCAPCVAAIGAIHREMGSVKWTLIAVGYQTALAYIISLLIYQFGRVLFLGHTVSAGTIAAIAAALILIWLVVRPDSNKKIKPPQNATS